MWKHGTVGDVLSLMQNGVNCKQNKNGHGLKITRIETISESKINYKKTGFASLDETQKEKAELKEGDILFSHINSPIHVGKTAIYNGEEPLYHGINLLRLNTIEDVDSSYFNYFLCSLFRNGYWKRTAKQSINQASVNQKDIRCVPFSYPILSEQQRIVAKLDAAFAEIDNSERILKIRLNKLSNLLNSYIEEKLRNLKNNFPVVELKEVIKSVQYGTSKKCSKEGKYTVLRMGNMQGGKFILDDLVYIDDQLEANKFQISKFDVFFNRTNSALHVGKTAIWEGSEKALFAGYLIKINYDKSKVDPYFLNFFLNVDSTRKYGYSVMTESINQANINGTKLKKYPFIRADLVTQKKLASKFIDLENKISEAINLTKQSLELYGKLKDRIFLREFEKS